MPLGQFANETVMACTAPLLNQADFGTAGGYIAGRYCGLGSFEDGTTCCFPCPIQDWQYPPEWEDQLRIPNYLSVLSVILCCFLLVSFVVLPASRTHRHHLSVGLLFPVLFISTSFVIPVAVDPPMCYDAITPHDMRSSQSCAWTGALVTLGGLGCAVWVFLRSLWLHIRIFWDRDPGRMFKWGSILVGTLLPIVFSHRHALHNRLHLPHGADLPPKPRERILHLLAMAHYLLYRRVPPQVVTTAYCIWVYLRTRRAEAARNASYAQHQRKANTWHTVKELFLLQWRNIAVCVLTIIGSIAFFIVFWSQDSKLGRVFNDPQNIKPVKTWIVCHTLSRGDKDECRRYVEGFTVPRSSVLASLILASLVGIEIFILLFRFSMLLAWRDLLISLSYRAKINRPPSPELTSLDNPDQYLVQPKRSTFDSETPSSDHRSSGAGRAEELDDLSPTLHRRPGYERVTSESGLLAPATSNSGWDQSGESSRAETPGAFGNTRGVLDPNVHVLTSPQPVAQSASSIRAAPGPRIAEEDGNEGLKRGRSERLRAAYRRLCLGALCMSMGLVSPGRRWGGQFDLLGVV
ncbi:hypothetical protein M011DRAFT_476628 [Sporormia fimetaria CBS 119925]|uniref:G-protein coupled receptors family 2 profile 2 domain-containing protein n=1 Tax=Sporormia fimetaria CBS 119925 TaxID=1340428 RepID=A0A6A6VDS2_9PLEO|nr:hypothetical protein M011DRAFT_476628 [Sporormia fimetaria CBS 119925]